MQLSFKKLNSRALKILNFSMHILMWVPCILVAIFWNRIPERIAQHFHGAGEIDIIGNKNVLIASLSINVIIYLFHFFAMYAFPYIIDSTYLFKERIRYKVTSEDLQKALIIILKLVGYMNIIVLLLMVYALWHIIKCTSLVAWFIPVFLGALAIEVIYFIWKYLKLRKEIRMRK